MMRFLATLVLFIMGGCTRIPSGLVPVQSLDLDQYLGKWYEIARLDHSFERGMHKVTAQYTLLDDGTIQVINRGYLVEEKRWKQAEGRAKFATTPDQGHLKVSFWGPFYSSYVILYVDDLYQHAMICGPTKEYFWLLAREPVMEDEQRRRLVEKAASMGFEVDNLIYVHHD